MSSDRPPGALALSAAVAVAAALLAGSGSPPVAAQEVAATVDIRDFSFQPGDVRIVAGTAVRWINHDDTPHQVAMEGNRPGSSSLIDPQKEHTFVFREAGRYVYRCGVHPTMLGEIFVQGP